jgi:rare lipoprotein A
MHLSILSFSLLFVFLLSLSFLQHVIAAPILGPRHGLAAWYGDQYRGRPMANGKAFDPDAMTCASRDYPLGTILQVWRNSRHCIVTVTDRGPALRLYHAGRIIDLSRAAFARLDELDAGVIEVDVFEADRGLYGYDLSKPAGRPEVAR